VPKQQVLGTSLQESNWLKICTSTSNKAVMQNNEILYFLVDLISKPAEAFHIRTHASWFKFSSYILWREIDKGMVKTGCYVRESLRKANSYVDDCIYSNLGQNWKSYQHLD